MDGRLRNGLWNAVTGDLLQEIAMGPGALLHLNGYGPPALVVFFERIWVEFRGGARDMFPHVEPVTDLRQWFYAASWNEAYDLLEFIAADVQSSEFQDACNAALEREHAVYRMVDSRIIELTDERQLATIDEAIAGTESTPNVREQLRTALDRLADRPEADYRNAMKEAISAVETLVGTISGSPKATLDAGLKLIGSRKLLPIHPSLLASWGALYGYTSDAGVRHGLRDGKPAVTLEDALYLVVSCSAIVSYLLAHARKAGLELT
jgi:hypothetical protein